MRCLGTAAAVIYSRTQLAGTANRINNTAAVKGKKLVCAVQDQSMKMGAMQSSRLSLSLWLDSNRICVGDKFNGGGGGSSA